MLANKVLFIGCGRLGQCFLELYSQKKIFQEIIVVEPSLSVSENFPNTQFFPTIRELPPSFSPEIVFLLVKPNLIPTVLSELVHLPKNVLFISSAAMVTLGTMHKILPEHKIVRVMPNTGIKVETSLTLAYTEKGSDLDKKLVEKIFSYSGGLFWVEKEEFIEKLTPMTGSGPALFFQLALAVEQKIRECKIEPKDARRLAISVLEASALLAKKNSDLESQIDSISSKGGITEAMLTVFTPLLSFAMDQTVEYSYQKIKETK